MCVLGGLVQLYVLWRIVSTASHELHEANKRLDELLRREKEIIARREVAEFEEYPFLADPPVPTGYAEQDYAPNFLFEDAVCPYNGLSAQPHSLRHQLCGLF